MITIRIPKIEGHSSGREVDSPVDRKGKNWDICV